MKKTVKYPRAKFPPEAISEALAILDLSKAGGFDTVDVGDASWTVEDNDEFFALYRSDCRYAYFNRGNAGRVEITLSFFRGQQTDISIGAATRPMIESAFAVFEARREAATAPAPKAAPKPLPLPPRVFIGHGRASDWRDLKDHLHEQHHYPVDAYEAGARTGHAIRDVLDGMLKSASFAVLVMTAEDEMIDGQMRPRENVVHETGLFQGRLGWTRAIMLVESGVEPFSNVAGIQQIRYDKGHIRSTYGDVLAALRREFGAGPFAPLSSM